LIQHHLVERLQRKKQGKSSLCKPNATKLKVKPYRRSQEQPLSQRNQYFGLASIRTRTGAPRLTGFLSCDLMSRERHVEILLAPENGGIGMQYRSRHHLYRKIIPCCPIVVTDLLLNLLTCLYSYIRHKLVEII